MTAKNYNYNYNDNVTYVYNNNDADNDNDNSNDDDNVILRSGQVAGYWHSNDSPEDLMKFDSKLDIDH